MSSRFYKFLIFEFRVHSINHLIMSPTSSTAISGNSDVINLWLDSTPEPRPSMLNNIGWNWKDPNPKVRAETDYTDTDYAGLIAPPDYKSAAKPPVLVLSEMSVVKWVVNATQSRVNAALREYFTLSYRSFKQFIQKPLVNGIPPLMILLDISPEYYRERIGVINTIRALRNNATIFAIALAHLEQMSTDPNTGNQKLARSHGLDGALPQYAEREVFLNRLLELYDQMSIEAQDGFRASEGAIAHGANTSRVITQHQFQAA
jgi:hypothetical protein